MINPRTKKLTTLGMLSALAFLMVFFIRIPILPAAPFLKYEPKDIIILITGFIFGPLSVVIVSCVVSLVELVTISTTGLIGLVMNILSTVSFAAPAAYFYKKDRNAGNVILGLVLGAISTTIVMLLWNYMLTPIFMNIPREKVVPLLTSAILPFNLLKSGINASLALILYKPLVTALRRANFIEESSSRKTHFQPIFVSLFILITAVLFILVLNGII